MDINDMEGYDDPEQGSFEYIFICNIWPKVVTYRIISILDSDCDYEESYRSRKRGSKNRTSARSGEIFMMNFHVLSMLLVSFFVT
jgi:hypothetical protein